MSHPNYHNLVNAGRKAGLTTTELYQALATVQPDRGSPVNGQTDTNGYTSERTKNGHNVYRPANEQTSAKNNHLTGSTQQSDV